MDSVIDKTKAAELAANSLFFPSWDNKPIATLQGSKIIIPSTAGRVVPLKTDDKHRPIVEKEDNDKIPSDWFRGNLKPDNLVYAWGALKVRNNKGCTLYEITPEGTIKLYYLGEKTKTGYLEVERVS